MYFSYRMINHLLSIYIAPVNDDDSNLLYICGFDTGIPRILEGYSKDFF